MGRGGRRGRSGGGSYGSGGRSSGNHLEGGLLRLRNSTGGGRTYQEDRSNDMPIDEFLKQFMSEDKMCKLFLDNFYKCFRKSGDACVNISHTHGITKCPAKYCEAFVEHLELDSPVKGCDKDSVHSESLEERCSWYLKTYETTVSVFGKDDGHVCLFGKIFAKCPDKFLDVFNRT